MHYSSVVQIILCAVLNKMNVGNIISGTYATDIVLGIYALGLLNDVDVLHEFQDFRASRTLEYIEHPQARSRGRPPPLETGVSLLAEASTTLAHP